MRQVLLGAIAGTAATVLMTTAMRRLFHRLPQQERYPMPPREILQTVSGGVDLTELERQHATLAAHLAYGAATGGVFAVITRQRKLHLGSLYGVIVWALSYSGWIQITGILSPAHKHPPRRNLAMIVAHLVWGAGLAGGLSELERVEQDIFSGTQTPDFAS